MEKTKMAKGKSLTAGRGNVDTATKIANLQAKLGASGVTAANRILKDFEPDVVRLASLTLVSQKQVTLGKRVTEMLASIPDKAVREQTRVNLLAAKVAKAKAAKQAVAA